MGKRNRRMETAYETRLAERTRQRQDAKEAARFDGVTESNRAGRRIMGVDKPFPKFRSEAEADAWLERQAKKQARIEADRQRALASDYKRSDAEVRRLAGQIRGAQPIVMPAGAITTNATLSWTSDTITLTYT